jgi:hypothetical protein
MYRMMVRIKRSAIISPAIEHGAVLDNGIPSLFAYQVHLSLDFHSTLLRSYS